MCCGSINGLGVTSSTGFCGLLFNTALHCRKLLRSVFSMGLSINLKRDTLVAMKRLFKLILCSWTDMLSIDCKSPGQFFGAIILSLLKKSNVFSKFARHPAPLSSVWCGGVWFFFFFFPPRNFQRRVKSGPWLASLKNSHSVLESVLMCVLNFRLIFI